MEIKWPNVVFFGLLVFSTILLIRSREAVFEFLSQMGNMGPEHPTDERYWGLLVFSLLAIAMVALVRIFVDHRNQEWVPHS